MKTATYFYLGIILSAIVNCVPSNSSDNPINNFSKNNMNANITDTATFGAGCFWCVEAQFQLLEGVISVRSGFMGGHIKNPAYKEVCMGTTGHAEVCQISFDSSKISYDELLAAFWQSHDPTQLNRQGNDVGTQYRSVIFYHNDEQKKLAEKYKLELNNSGAWAQPIVTEISPASVFYMADDYHQNYFNLNGDQPYCSYIIQPKVEKFRKVFKEKLKK
ncbi:MAG: peptide-methionine (S)-S-oxide reductase MsrA [Bacteroidetes bacterium]|nr:peptide-methionine (S)-S-oxide reductase MsrA [Bacteroidota bacterium]